MVIFDTGCSAAVAGKRPGVPLCPGAFLSFRIKKGGRHLPPAFLAVRLAAHVSNG